MEELRTRREVLKKHLAKEEYSSLPTSGSGLDCLCYWPSVGDVLSTSFTWAATEQGQDYWSDMCAKYRDVKINPVPFWLSLKEKI